MGKWEKFQAALKCNGQTTQSDSRDNTKLARAASALQEQKISIIDGVSCKNGAGIVGGQLVVDTKAGQCGQCGPTLTARQMGVTGETRIPLDRPQIIIIGVPQDRGLTFAARYTMRGAGGSLTCRKGWSHGGTTSDLHT